MSAVETLVGQVLAGWPDHRAQVEKSLALHDGDSQHFLENIASFILQATDDVAELVDSYKFTCGELLNEELHFRRTGKYRCQSAQEANDLVYSNGPYMARYLQGLLLSQLLWHNHASAYIIFARDFLPALRRGYRALEVGPGHGLFIGTAARDPRCAAVSIWDISPESIAQTRAVMAKLGCAQKLDAQLVDVTRANSPDTFDAIILSDLLEHLEDPQDVLRRLTGNLAAGGRMFVNFPINSPAPDHIFQLGSPDEVSALIEGAGLMVRRLAPLPMTGQNLERALRQKLTVSCVAIASARDDADS